MLCRENVVSIAVYLQDLARDVYTQSPAYEIWSLLSVFFFGRFDESAAGDIGGTMGLCVGASVLSFFEFCDLLLLDRVFGKGA